MNENAMFFYRDGKQNTEFKPNKLHMNFYISKKKHETNPKNLEKTACIFFFAHNLNSLFCADVILVIRAIKSVIKVKN